MSASAADAPSMQTLAATLRRELARARGRARDATQRAASLDAELRSARAEEAAARAAVESLEAVLEQAVAVVGDLAEDDVHVEALLQEVGVEVHVVEELRGDEPDVEVLAGARLREMAVRVALRRGAVGQSVHWRDWYGWLRKAGFDGRGKRGAATFLTQLARSPLVRRADQHGVYVLDLDRFGEEGHRLGLLHDELSALPAPGQTSLLDDLGDLRERRRELQARVEQGERNLEEMVRVLSQELPPGWPPDAESEPHRVVEAWLYRFGDCPDQPPLID